MGRKGKGLHYNILTIKKNHRTFTGTLILNVRKNIVHYILNCLAVVVVFWSHGAVSSDSEPLDPWEYDKFIHGYSVDPSATVPQSTAFDPDDPQSYEKIVPGYNTVKGLGFSTVQYSPVLPTVAECMENPWLFELFVRGPGSIAQTEPEDCDAAIEGYFSGFQDGGTPTGEGLMKAILNCSKKHIVVVYGEEACVHGYGIHPGDQVTQTYERD